MSGKNVNISTVGVSNPENLNRDVNLLPGAKQHRLRLNPCPRAIIDEDHVVYVIAAKIADAVASSTRFRMSSRLIESSIKAK